eukprot:1186997-Prorocentrum_minimum.AAC.8
MFFAFDTFVRSSQTLSDEYNHMRQQLTDYKLWASSQPGMATHNITSAMARLPAPSSHGGSPPHPMTSSPPGMPTSTGNGHMGGLGGQAALGREASVGSNGERSQPHNCNAHFSFSSE